MRLKTLISRGLPAAAAALLATLLTMQPAAAAAATMQGIDVSSWQSPTVTQTAQADFAIVKATQGVGYTSPYLYQQANGALASGKKLGLYHYAGGSSCTAEADYFVETIRPWLRRAVLVLDWESNQNSSWGDSAWSTCFVQRVKDTTGVTPMVYVQASALWQVQGARAAGSGLWVAQYASMAATGYQSQPWNLGAAGEAMRQYTSNGWIPGYAGALDLDLFLGSREQWDRYANPSSKPVSPAPQPTPAPAPSPAPTTRQCVTVRAGDSLSTIAARYGGVWSDWTGYKSGNPGLIYVGETVCRGVSSPQVAQPHATTTPGAIHVVAAGETLSSIAARYGTTWQTLQRINSIPNANMIYAGQKLVVSGGYGSVSSGSRYHTVSTGETLSSIAARYGTSWQRLQQLNGIRNANLIYPGQRLVIG